MSLAAALSGGLPRAILPLAGGGGAAVRTVANIPGIQWGLLATDAMSLSGSSILSVTPSYGPTSTAPAGHRPNYNASYNGRKAITDPGATWCLLAGSGIPVVLPVTVLIGLRLTTVGGVILQRSSAVAGNYTGPGLYAKVSGIGPGVVWGSTGATNGNLTANTWQRLKMTLTSTLVTAVIDGGSPQTASVTASDLTTWDGLSDTAYAVTGGSQYLAGAVSGLVLVTGQGISAGDETLAWAKIEQTG